MFRFMSFMLSLAQDITGWGENDRGVSWTFGGDIVNSFLNMNQFSLVARAHQVFPLYIVSEGGGEQLHVKNIHNT